MMVTVSMTESTDTGVAVVMSMSVAMVSDIVSVMRMHWNGYWDWTVNVHWNVLGVDDWVWCWHLIISYLYHEFIVQNCTKISNFLHELERLLGVRRVQHMDDLRVPDVWNIFGNETQFE